MASYEDEHGGSVHAPLSVCKYLNQQGHPAEIIAPYDGKDNDRYLADLYPEVPAHRAARCFPRRYSNSAQLWTWLQRNLPRFDLVEIHGIWVLSSYLTALQCRQHAIPYLVRPHGSLDPFDLRKHARLKKRLGPWAVRWLLNGARAIVCTATREADLLESYGSQCRRQVVSLPVTLPTASGDRVGFRQRWSIPESAPVVLFLSRLNYKKGLDVLIPAIARLLPDFPDLVLVVAGRGEASFERHLDEIIQSAGIAKSVRKTGFLTGQPKVDALSAADGFALPSLNENFGIVNVEAMHAGLPLVISDQVYIGREVVEAGAGILCQHEVESVAESLRVLLSNPEAAKEIGRNGQRAVAERFHPRSATDALLRLYRELAR